MGSYLFGNSLEEAIKQLSFLDRYCMSIFFEEAIKKDQAAHVLFFNNKPACLTGPALKSRDKKFKDILVLRGWRAFKKNEHLFLHPNFIFTENLFGDSDNFKILHIYIINKSSLRSCLIKHKLLFQETLGTQFSPDEFIAHLERGASLPSLINKSELLHGLILGYGEDASKDFQRMMSIYAKDIAPPLTETYNFIDLIVPDGCKINPVVFMGNPNSLEVQQLVSTYEKELQETWSIYKNKIPLKAVLEKLCTSNDQEKG